MARFYMNTPKTCMNIDKGRFFSVRGPHYMPDMNIHAKIPVDLFHKLPCDMFRIEFQCLRACPFNFEICGIFEELLAITAIPRITVLNFTTKPQLLRNKKKTLRT